MIAYPARGPVVTSLRLTSLRRYTGKVSCNVLRFVHFFGCSPSDALLTVSKSSKSYWYLHFCYRNFRIFFSPLDDAAILIQLPGMCGNLIRIANCHSISSRPVAFQPGESGLMHGSALSISAIVTQKSPENANIDSEGFRVANPRQR
jgi:hypothetical protein